MKTLRCSVVAAVAAVPAAADMAAAKAAAIALRLVCFGVVDGAAMLFVDGVTITAITSTSGHRIPDHRAGAKT